MDEMQFQSGIHGGQSKINCGFVLPSEKGQQSSVALHPSEGPLQSIVDSFRDCKTLHILHWKDNDILFLLQACISPLKFPTMVWLVEMAMALAMAVACTLTMLVYLVEMAMVVA
ncbi:hypothetical protein LIER_39870 [Lithospermum erythrorhizon]|uniref:Uncharacterized protein n=1 Tax=Lithospermum erythrorhizon TaxID=34254 RepID=A0AAV3QPD4_LITER